ncbi:MAG TPA: DUF2312 domain-containing protein [Hellea balneolensis]|uniref:DUF2312 domain-containing protein n=1 Tax=Hellea balneolensis TaxID=287478 RepID=A0A7V5U1Q4_9PROT|nr:DUF2312 domain-containing protein [Hellea balneolensis]
MGNVTPISGDTTQKKLREYIERIERLQEDKESIADGIKVVFAEAKSEGFDPKVMREVLKIRKMREDERQELDAVLQTYLAALGMA